MRQTIAEQLESINKVMKVGRPAPDKHIIGFGKFKGVTFEMLALCEPDYLRMLLEPCEKPVPHHIKVQIKKALEEVESDR